MRYVTVEVPVQVWQGVDAYVDNTVAIAAVDGAIDAVIAGACVRDAGWRAAAGAGGVADDGWPPSASLLPITLRESHWEWVLSQLHRWSAEEGDDRFFHFDATVRRALRPPGD